MKNNDIISGKFRVYCYTLSTCACALGKKYYEHTYSLSRTSVHTNVGLMYRGEYIFHQVVGFH